MSDPRVAALAESLRKWRELARENPGEYWYEDENCLINADLADSNVVQVDPQGASVVRRRASVDITGAKGVCD